MWIIIFIGVVLAFTYGYVCGRRGRHEVKNYKLQGGGDEI